MLIFSPKSFNKKETLILQKVVSVPSYMMMSVIFPEIPVSKVAVFASHRNCCFLFFLSLLGSQCNGQGSMISVFAEKFLP